jgi:hypothetical protein
MVKATAKTKTKNDMTRSILVDADGCLSVETCYVIFWSVLVSRGRSLSRLMPSGRCYPLAIWSLSRCCLIMAIVLVSLCCKGPELSFSAF